MQLSEILAQNFSTYFSRSGTVQNEDGIFLPFDAQRLVDGKLVQEDIVILRIAHVDINTYNFFRSTYLMQNSNNNPFAEPMNLSNSFLLMIFDSLIKHGMKRI